MCSRSILAVRLRTDAYGTAFGSSKNVLCMFKIIFIVHPNVASICIREVFGRHSGSIRHVRKTFGKHALVIGEFGMNICRVLKAFGKHTESDRKGILSKSTCGKYSVYSETILKTFGKQTDIIRWYIEKNTFGGTLPAFGNTSAAFWKRSERVRHVLCSFGVFGKHTKHIVHSGSKRAVRKMFWKNAGRVLAIRYTFGGINETKSGKDTENVRKRSESIRYVLGPCRRKHTEP